MRTSNDNDTFVESEDRILVVPKVSPLHVATQSTERVLIYEPFELLI